MVAGVFTEIKRLSEEKKTVFSSLQQKYSELVVCMRTQTRCQNKNYFDFNTVILKNRSQIQNLNNFFQKKRIKFERIE